MLLKEYEDHYIFLLEHYFLTRFCVGSVMLTGTKRNL